LNTDNPQQAAGTNSSTKQLQQPLLSTWHTGCSCCWSRRRPLAVDSAAVQQVAAVGAASFEAQAAACSQLQQLHHCLLMRRCHSISLLLQGPEAAAWSAVTKVSG
jgi:hypothetical protein